MTTKKIRYTEPQQRIADRIARGDLVYTKDSHHMSGGTMVWFSDDSVVGYKAFWGFVHATHGFVSGASYPQYFVPKDVLFKHLIKRAVEEEKTHISFRGKLIEVRPILEDAKRRMEEAKLNKEKGGNK